MTKEGQMSRNFNTNTNGNDWDDKTKLLVWQKGTQIVSENPNLYRLDSCGALIEWSQFGVTDENGNGWEIDHIHPVARGGNDLLSNLQPLQWQNNRHKSDSISVNYCLIKRKTK